MWSSAPINMTIPAIEESLKNAKGNGSFEFLYPAELEAVLSNSLNLKNVRLHIKLNVHQIVDILHAVRNILLEWTLNMEKQGVLGENLMFSPEDKKKSEAVTAQTINHFSIGQVGSFVQSAKGSFVQGSVEATTTTTLSQSTLELVQQIDALLPASNLPAEIHAEAQAALGELKQAATASQPDRGRLQKGLETLKRALAPAGETLLKLAVDAAVAKLLNQH
jgi:hypothetical protein